MIAERVIARKTAAVRLDEIRSEIETTGTWTPTGGEVVFGAKLALRKVVDDRDDEFWRTLEVIDCRTAQVADSFAERCEEPWPESRAFAFVFPSAGRDDGAQNFVAKYLSQPKFDSCISAFIEIGGLEFNCRMGEGLAEES